MFARPRFNPWGSNTPVGWFVEQLFRETGGETSTAPGLLHHLEHDRDRKRFDALQHRQGALYVRQQVTSNGSCILEMTGVGQCDRYMFQLAHDSRRAFRFGQTSGYDQGAVRDFRKTYKNAPPRYIILHPDGTEETIGWCDLRGISGWFKQQRRETHRRCDDAVPTHLR